LVVGLVAHASALFIGSVPLDIASFILVVRGALTVCGGRRVMRAFEPAVLLSALLIPISPTLLSPLAPISERMTSVAAAAMLDLAGVPVFADGSQLHLSDTVLTILPATSGLRELEGVLAMCLAAALLLDRGRRCLFTFATAGIAHFRRGTEGAEAVLASFQGARLTAVAAVLVVIAMFVYVGVASFGLRSKAGSGQPRGA
jgi:hypothetical protein